MSAIQDIIVTNWEGIYISISTIMAIYFGWKAHKWKKLEVIPYCILRPTAHIKELEEPGSREKTGFVWLINTINIQHTGGVITYPKFHYIITFKDSKMIKHDTIDYAQMTTLLDDDKIGPWTDYVNMTKEESEYIESLYLALECKDIEEKNYITINKFDYVEKMWKVTRSIIKTKRKRSWNQGIIQSFINDPKKWIEKYGDIGKNV